MNFGKLVNGRYSKRYVAPQAWFYRTMISQLAQLSAGSILLDVGSGPGVIAEYADKGKLSLTILGIEPSRLVQDGIRLSKDLEAQGSTIQYLPKQGSIENSVGLFGLQQSSLDGIIMMRSAHEISKSIGRNKFILETKRLVSYLKPKGLFFVGDPTFRTDIVTEGETKHSKEIQLARKVLEGLIGHSHPIEENIHPQRMINILADAGCKRVVFFDSKPNAEVLKEMQKKDRNITRSPLEMYILVTMKQ